MICRNPRSMLLLWLLLLATTLLSACGEKEEPDPGEIGALAIGYAKTGGVAGVDRRVEITSADVLLVSLDGEPLHGADVDETLIARARTAVEGVDLDRLAVPGSKPPDSPSIVITYGQKRIAGTDEELRRLQPLRPALSAFDAILSAASATNEPRGPSSSP